jgi:hypothetical protein
MTNEEYRAEKQRIEKAAEKSQQELCITFVEENKRFHIGDIISKNDKIIKVKKIHAYRFDACPIPVYVGKLLKKDLTPRKDNAEDSIYGDKEVTLIKTTTIL